MTEEFLHLNIECKKEFVMALFRRFLALTQSLHRVRLGMPGGRVSFENLI